MGKTSVSTLLDKLSAKISEQYAEIERLQAENERLRADKYTVWATYPDC